MEKIYYSSISTFFLKNVFVASTERGLCKIDFLISEKEFVRELKKRFAGEVLRDDRKNKKVLTQLERYLEGKLKEFDCPLDPRGTAFEMRVWSELGKIPYGETRSYKDIARAIGRPNAFRAVGNANGANPIPLIVPCHRVIESNGGLGGYGQGIEVKKRLLELEKGIGI
jgi:methylated-DNA-[protein]-cysteine S-methyltransferase